MFLPRILLCLVLLAPLVGLAQGSGEAAVSAPPESEVLPPPPLVPAPEASQAEPAEEAAPAEGELFPHEYGSTRKPGKPFTVGRGVFEFVGGGVMGAGVGFVSLLLGAAVFSPICGNDAYACLIPVFLTGAVGAVFGASLGVYGAGKLLGAEGRYWPSFLGTLAGAALGIVGAVAAQNETATALSLTVGPVLGAIVGYELSHAYGQRGVLPSVGVTLTGDVTVGLSGRF